jgi:predicted dehydrogenase
LKAAVVGLGSIGQRHAEILSDLGAHVSVVSRRNVTGFLRFATVAELLSASEPDYVVVATETSGHVRSLRELDEAGFSGIVLIEKPVVAFPEPLPVSGFRTAYVGYNLRFHPALRALREWCSGQELYTATIQAGSFLPDWRPGRDFRKTSSASVQQGGGVLRDLSHELDYVRWLFGPPLQSTALGGRLGALGLDVDEAVSILARTVRVPLVTIHLSYLDREASRRITVSGERGTAVVDLITDSFLAGQDTRNWVIPRNQTYREMHEAALAEDPGQLLCTIPEALDVVRWIAGLEVSLGSEAPSA